jgi:hypothetical protein
MKESKASKVFGNIIGKRFDNEEAIETWIREFTGCKLKGLAIGELRHPKIEEGLEDLAIDDFMDCTFGEDECGRDYADFILYAIKTNANQLYITEADWMY